MGAHQPAGNRVKAPCARRSGNDFKAVSPAALLLAVVFGAACPARGHESPAVVVTGHYGHALGSADAASEGVFGAELVRSRALLRPAEVLEYIPGMVVTQHSGDGKANQYFLRGMNLDHGTDFATTINGVPVNMPTHGHGHGYSDLNILIPELVSRVEYRKGPYFAADGDFSSAGSANVVYRARVERPIYTLGVGERGYLRGFAAASHELSPGIGLLAAIEQLHHDGPWSVPAGLRKLHTHFALSGGSPQVNWSMSLAAYAARWNSTDQVPQRLIDAGTYQGRPFGRFDSLDPSDGASTRRVSLSGRWRAADDHGLTQLEWYAIQYSLDLFSNFTYMLERDTDQFAQTDHRTVLGGKASRSWILPLGGDRSMQSTLGVQVRQDRIRVGLFDSAQRDLRATVRDDRVRQTLMSLYGENRIAWTSWLRSVAGLRADQLDAQVTGLAQAENSGRATAFRWSPKLSLVFGPWKETEIFLNAGRGFHSNDARGATAGVDPRTSLPVERVPALVGSEGREVGMKTRILPNLQTALALWQLKFDSELVYVGDAGTTEAGRPSRRSGVEWSSHWSQGQTLLMDLNLAWTRPRYSDGDLVGNRIPNAVQKVANLSLALRNLGNWSGAIGVRYLGSAPLLEDDSARSRASLTTNLRISKTVGEGLSLALEVFNLWDRKNSDISYHYTSRVAGEPPSGVPGLHLHPAEPRTLRATARYRI
ncbi:MAG: TonB-dependent receptor [Betaproteobacteria bacterium]|nr:TonB-dependent receptor [Betaproteobacteria bacterium]